MASDPTEAVPGGSDAPYDQLGRVGPFRLLEQIGEGGMGIVYLAERKEPVAQRVALKVIRTGRLDHTYRARFAMEQQALARMDHPNVARLLDAGDDDGKSWFAMEYVPGQPLSDYCRDHRLSLEQRLRLFGQVCDGVQHAHMKGILHRDIKPGNIMVREVDGRPVAKIIDFGLAQPVDPLQIRASLHEAMRQIVGTLVYMSPEQAARQEGDLDTRTDVYSLGVVLYEMLTGELPLDMESIEREGLGAFAVLLRDHTPKKPSTRISSLGPRLQATAAERCLSPHKLRSLVRGELDWVTMKALARDRQRRYLTVRDLGREIERYLAQQPVEAGPPTTWYAIRKWVQRHRVAFSVVAVFLVAGILVSLVMWNLSAHAKEVERRSAIIDRSAVLAEHIRRADDLWPADAQNCVPIQEWLNEAERLQALGADVEKLAVVLDREYNANATANDDSIAKAAFVEQQRILRQRLAMVTKLQAMMPIVGARLHRAQTLQQRTIANHQEAWQQASQRVADDVRFGDFELSPIAGLVPLGPNPKSDLEEFYLLDSSGDSTLPQRDGRENFRIGAMTGMNGDLWVRHANTASLWQVNPSTGAILNTYGIQSPTDPSYTGVNGMSVDTLGRILAVQRLNFGPPQPQPAPPCEVQRINPATGTIEVSTVLAVGGVEALGTQDGPSTPVQWSMVVNPTGDTDLDGDTNLAEIQNGTSPIDPSSSSRFSIDTTGNTGIGGTVSINVRQTSGVYVWVTAFTSGLLGAPTQIPGFVGDLVIDPSTVIVLTTGVGSTNTPLTIPTNPALAGFTMYMQSTFIDGSLFYFSNMSGIAVW